MVDTPIIDYSRPEKKASAHRVIFWVMVMLALVVCLWTGWAAIESAMYAKWWKQNGYDPIAGALVEGYSQQKAIEAVIICAVVAAAWLLYFFNRRNRRKAG